VPSIGFFNAHRGARLIDPMLAITTVLVYSMEISGYTYPSVKAWKYLLDSAGSGWLMLYLEGARRYLILSNNINLRPENIALK